MLTKGKLSSIPLQLIPSGNSYNNEMEMIIY